MKKIIVLGLILLMAAVGFAATKTATCNWTQPAADLPILKGWNVYYATTSGGPYTLLAAVLYDGSPKPNYTGSGTINQADGTLKTYYFICRALGKSGIESANSNEVSAVIDLTVPGVPVTFTVTITN